MPIGRRGDDVELRRVPALPSATSIATDRPTVLLLDRALARSVASADALTELSHHLAILGLGEAGEVEPGPEMPTDVLTGWVPADARPAMFAAALHGAFRHAASILDARLAREGESARHSELGELTRVGIALTTERDLPTLLELILTQARRVTDADAGSLYLVERDAEGQARSLRFKHAQNASVSAIPLREFEIPIDHGSLAGYVAMTGAPLAIGDVYALPDDASYRLNRSFDESTGYRTQSMLVLPMRSHRDDIVGVLQLINRKRNGSTRLTSAEVTTREVLPFDERSIAVANALAAQAAVAIENSLLYESIERLLEGFVSAAVTAIESRDPTTSGHSARVATLSVGLAEAIDRGGVGQYRDVRFSREEIRELRFAAMLHDFGKVGVREHVLVKRQKLYPADLERVRQRIAFAMQGADLAFERARAERLLTGGHEALLAELPALEGTRHERRERLRRLSEIVDAANEPSVLADTTIAQISDLATERFIDAEGVEHPLLEPDELRFLMIPKGNLDEHERREIESHVTHTFRFLSRIPWTRELQRVPAIAYAHHEKLDGSGYPRRLAAESIPVQTRIMTISDIFDALTASDRPYKRAVPATMALDILSREASAGMLDRGLLGIFVESRVWESVFRSD